uniref:Uncharacterized protein n=1 Tax=Myotis myotis TaxID=51298 RepID=A0A7J7SRJ8_MYOMY|nr:hypothetical protein mMyoMyo1_009361 [Myotis myotis]
MLYEEEGKVHRPAGCVGYGRGQECLRGSRGWAVGSPNHQAPEPSSAPSPRPVNKPTGIRWCCGEWGGGGRSSQGSMSYGGESAAPLAGRSGRQVLDGAGAPAGKGRMLCARRLVRAPPVGVGVSVRAPWPALHAAAQRGKPQAPGLPFPPAGAGPASPVPKPFHPSLLRPGLATAPVITQGPDAKARPALTPWGGAWGGGGPRLAPRPAPPSGRKCVRSDVPGGP